MTDLAAMTPEKRYLYTTYLSDGEVATGLTETEIVDRLAHLRDADRKAGALEELRKLDTISQHTVWEHVATRIAELEKP